MTETDIHSVGNSLKSRTTLSDVVCFSHLRWRFVYQRPQHLLTRAGARAQRVFFVEEPLVRDVERAELLIQREPGNVEVLTPVLPPGEDAEQAVKAQRDLLDKFFEARGIEDFIAWYYTPMALRFSGHLRPRVTVYDCMDELSAFRGAPPELLQLEKQLFERANVVFTGGRSLYQAKRSQHHNLHVFPSSVDVQHFGAARLSDELQDPADQAGIPRPRIGFFGVLDERLDLELLRDMADRRPEWHFLLVGPIVKIGEDQLPRAANIHYLGQKDYKELPGYLAHWDVAMLPFARNESTRFISPTKTPEYLAGGKPVVSTPIHDVEVPYGKLGLARIASNADEFCEAIAESLTPRGREWLAAVDEFLEQTSWDRTFEGMWGEVLRACQSPQRSAEKGVLANV